VKKFILILLSLVSLTVYASQTAQELSIDTKKRLFARVGAGTANRIWVEGDRIAEVTGNASEYIIQGNEQGQVFITPRIEVGKSINITLITENGLVQDLTMRVQGNEPEAIVLKKNNITISSTIESKRSLGFARRITQQEDPYYEVVEFFKQMANGSGDRIRNPKLTDKALSVVITEGFTGQKLLGYRLKLINKTLDPKPLREQDFINLFSGIIAISLDSETLYPNQGANVYFVRVR
jgi:hypothetical protein